MPNKKGRTRTPRPSKKSAAINESLEFMRDRTARMRKEAQSVRFTYHPREPDTINPRPIARRIKRAVESPKTPHDSWLKIRDRVIIMVLCAGNMLSCDAPLESQYLAAFQRITDASAMQMLHTPEELERHMALIHADRLIKDALDELDAITKGGARHE